LVVASRSSTPGTKISRRLPVDAVNVQVQRALIPRPDAEGGWRRGHERVALCRCCCERTEGRSLQLDQ